MDKVTIIISNYNSLHWLRICVHQIRKHTKIPYHILISEQSQDHYPVQAEYNGWDNVTVVPMDGHSSGYGTDYILKNMQIDSEYICSMDVDTFPISDDWLSEPIRLLNQYDLTWVGLRAEIEAAYNLHYFHMGECYRIGRTKDFKLLSECIGWAQVKGPEFRDNAVRAHSFEDANFKHKKFSFPVTGRIGLTRSEGEYGRVIGNLVIHFCFAFTSTLHQVPVKNMGEDYMTWEQKIKTLQPDELVSEIMSSVNYSNRLQPMQYWDGTDYAQVPYELREDAKRIMKQSGHLDVSINDISSELGIKIKGVIHIGANKGREYLEYSEDNISNVIFIEQNTFYFNKLIQECPPNYICYRLAIGAENKTIILDPPKQGDVGILTTTTRIDNIPFDKSKFNVLVLGRDVDKQNALVGAVGIINAFDIIYCENTSHDTGSDFSLLGIKVHKRVQASDSLEIVIYTKA